MTAKSLETLSRNLPSIAVFRVNVLLLQELQAPFKETLTWDKKKRKQAGLPPNRYFEQMWELSINPSTGKLDNDGLNIIRENLIAR